jgi:hypothetical protein
MFVVRLEQVGNPANKLDDKVSGTARRDDHDGDGDDRREHYPSKSRRSSWIRQSRTVAAQLLTSRAKSGWIPVASLPITALNLEGVTASETSILAGACLYPGRVAFPRLGFVHYCTPAANPR